MDLKIACPLLIALLLGSTGLAVSFRLGISDGDVAQNQDLQFMVSVQEGEKHHCGGFLISDRFVVTAGHCKFRNCSIVYSSHNLRQVKQWQRIKVQKTFRHENYTDKPLHNDIMLLQLAKPVKLNKGVKVAQLPKKRSTLENDAKCRVAGWGMTSHGPTDDLNVVTVKVLNRNKCAHFWKTRNVVITDKMLCTGSFKTEKGFCKGDSGGPLVCDNKAQGIVSFKHESECRYPDLPNVYTSVAAYADWIQAHLRRSTDD
ncbi:anionic trypsin-2-like [Polypterus senegalus]|uniref:anionic trypsin-2-like n=1 Tax=Polypterus senegalus TaxID=55291 RepID=UPI001962E961|nr:anionic trypsin-2-like [Polypterus senegalus]